MFRNKLAAVAIAMSLLTALCSGTLFAGATSGSTMLTTPDLATEGVVTAREEVIYASLTANGAIRALYAVTALEVNKPGAISDYGRFSTVKNLTSTAPLSYGDNQVTVNAPAGRFYYQGNLSELSLPWEISIIYRLDGQQLSPEELAGKSGKLVIEISTKPDNHSDQVYYDNYLLQVSLTLDTAKYIDIDAGTGTVANAGRNKIVTYTMMPGKPGNVLLRADVTDMTLSPIEIAALPFSLQIETPDTTLLTREMSALTDGVASLHQGMTGLKGGVAELRQGATALATGSGQFSQGLGQLDASSTELLTGSGQIMHALNAMSTAMAGSPGEFSLGSMAQLPQILAQLGLGLVDISAGLTELNQGFALAFEALDGAIATIPGDEITQEQLGILYASNPQLKTLLDSLVQYYTAGRTVKATHEAVKPGFAAMGMSLTPIISSVDTIAGSLAAMSEQIGMAMQSDASAAMLGDLLQGITELAEQYRGFHAGLSTYTGGLTELAQAYAPLQGGLTGLAQGSAELSKGANLLHAGTGELNAGLKDLPGRMTDEIEQLVGQYDKSDFQPVSFLSEHNKLTTAVQFVMRTERIERAAIPAEPEQQPAPLTFWNRLVDLFRQ